MNIYIYMLKIIYLSLQVIDNKHYHKTGTLHIGCNFWKSIWVKITMFYHIYILLLQNARNLHDMLIVTVVFGRYKWESFYGMGPRISQFTRVEIDTHGMYEWIEQFILGHYGRKGVHQRISADVLRSHVSAIFWRRLTHSRGRARVRGQIDRPICPCWSVIRWVSVPPVFKPRLQHASMSHTWCQKYHNENHWRLYMLNITVCKIWSW